MGSIEFMSTELPSRIYLHGCHKKNSHGRKTVEILSAAEFNDVGNAYQGKGLTFWCGGREVEAPTTWQVAIFWIQG